MNWQNVSPKLQAAWSTLRRASRRPLLRWLFTAGLVLIVSASLGLILYRNRTLLLTYDWRIRPIPLVASFFLYSVALSLAILGWGLIINRLSGRRSWLRHIRIYCLTNLGQRLPGVFWHILGRMAMYQEDGVSKRMVSIGSGLELVLLIVSGLIVSLGAWPLGVVSETERWLWFLAGILIGLILLHPRLARPLLSRLGLSQTSWAYRHIVLWLLLYVVIWILGGVILYCIINIVYPLAPDKLPGVVAAWSTSGVIASLSTFTPSGFGLREISLSVLLAPFMPSGIAVVIAIATRALLTAYEIIWALLTGWWTGIRLKNGTFEPVSPMIPSPEADNHPDLTQKDY